MRFKQFLQALAIRYLFTPQTSSAADQNPDLFTLTPSDLAVLSQFKYSKKNQAIIDEVKKHLEPLCRPAAVSADNPE